MANRALSSVTAIKSILTNHSARVFKGAKAWLATRPENRFTFFFVLLLHSATRLLAHLVDGFFSKLALRAASYPGCFQTSA